MEKIGDLAQALSDNPAFESCDTPDTDCNMSSVHKTRRRKSRKTESSGQGRRRVTSDRSFSSGDDPTRSYTRSHRPRCLHSDSDESHVESSRISTRQHWLTRTSSTQSENRMDSRHSSEHTVRRRRRQGRMSVDGCPPNASAKSKDICPIINAVKRKRRRSVTIYRPHANCSSVDDDDDMEYSDPSSYLSSDENRGFVTNDEGREGDDEQSDFFHEPSCSTFGVVSLMESDPLRGSHVESDGDDVKNPHLCRLFSDCFLSIGDKCSEDHHPPKIARVFKHKGREFRQGCRRIDRRDICDDSVLTRPLSLGVIGPDVNSDTGGEKKRRKRTDQGLRHHHHEPR